MSAGLKLEKQEDNLPPGWDRVSIGEISDLGGGTTPSKSNDDYWHGSIPWASPKDFDGVSLDETKDKITEYAVSENSINLYKRGDIAMVVRSGVLRHSLPVAQLSNEMAVNQDIKVLKPDTERIATDYLLNILLYEANRIRASCAKTGTTVESIETGFLKGYKLPLPPLPEQRRIADILSTVDEKIQQTDEIIEAKQDLTQGLINELVKTGVQDSPGTHEVQIGPKQIEIPTNWDLLRVDELVIDDDDAIRTGPFGSKLKKEYLVSEGVKVYEQSNVYDKDFTQGNRYVTQDRYESELTSYDANPGDVLITLQGTIGDAAVLPDNAEPGVINQKLMRVRVDPGLCLPEYFATFFDESHLADFQIEAVSHGAVVSGLNISTISGIRVPIPSLQEQQKIVDIVESSKSSLAEEQETKQHLRELKRGLMQDLLTGKVRVNTD